jgi:hypothetical protein
MLSLKCVLCLSHVTRHTSHVTRHTSHVTRHTSHVTCRTSHVTSPPPHSPPQTFTLFPSSNLHPRADAEASQSKPVAFYVCADSREPWNRIVALFGKDIIFSASVAAGRIGRVTKEVLATRFDARVFDARVFDARVASCCKLPPFAAAHARQRLPARPFSSFQTTSPSHKVTFLVLPFPNLHTTSKFAHHLHNTCTPPQDPKP